MKSTTYLTSLILAGGLALVSTAQAQYITGGQYIQNTTAPGAGYGNWGAATFQYTSTGIEVDNAYAGGYGGAYFVINSGVQTLNAADTQINFTFTVNGDPSQFVWFSPGQLVLNDDNAPNVGAWYYNMPYLGYNNAGNPANVTWDGATATVTVPITGGLLGNIQTGNDHIYAISLDTDAAVINNNPYSITFNSIQFTTVPEPASMALLGLGAAVLLVSRRRK